MIQLFCERGDGITGALIRYRVRGPYSHCGLLFNQDYAIEATHSGVIKQAFSPQRLKNSVLFNINVCGFNEYAVRVFAEAQLGKGYDWPGVIDFVTGTTQEARKSKGKWFCSELAIAALNKGCEPLRLLNVDPYLVDPYTITFSPRLTELYGKTISGV